jgi:hypothetical protein
MPFSNDDDSDAPFSCHGRSGDSSVSLTLYEHIYISYVPELS